MTNDFLAQSTIGETLFSQGKYQEAENVFRQILEHLEEIPSDKRCTALNRLGRCLKYQGKAADAINQYRQAISEAQTLESTDTLQRNIATIHSDLGDALREIGEYEQAKEAYSAALAIDQSLGNNPKGEADTKGQLGGLAIAMGKLEDAEKYYREILEIYQTFHEPLKEAGIKYRLAMIYRLQNQLQKAEDYYRQALEIFVSQDELKWVSATRNEMAQLCEESGRPQDAELWYCEAIKGYRQLENEKKSLAQSLGNFADLLYNQPNRLAEALTLAKEALMINKNFDPNEVAIWIDYSILAKITDKQGNKDAARSYRRLMRQTKWNAPVTQYELQQHGDFIQGVVIATQDAEVRKQLETVMQQFPPEYNNLINAIHLFLNGERDEDTLYDGLGHGDSMIMMGILLNYEL